MSREPPEWLPDVCGAYLLDLCWSEFYRRLASAIEAQRAATAQTGAVHESAVAESQTPNSSEDTA